MSKHKHIIESKCPRCGGYNTVSCGCDGTPTTTWLCNDCEGRGVDDATYSIVRGNRIQSVNWDDRTVYDTRYHLQQRALEMQEVLQEFVADIEAAYPPGTSAAADLAKEWPDLGATYRKAKAVA